MTRPYRAILFAGFASAIALGTLPLAAETTRGGTVTLGMLTCDLVRDANLIVFSREDYACTYRASNGGSDRYDGQVSKIGADLEFKSGQTLKWVVLAPSAIRGPGILEGTYAGGSAEATVVGGVGARALLAARATRSRCNRSASRARPASVPPQPSSALSLSPVRG